MHNSFIIRIFDSIVNKKEIHYNKSKTLHQHTAGDKE